MSDDGRRPRFIQPQTTRLQLADVHRRAHAVLLKRTTPTVATPAEIAASAARVAEAEHLGDWIEVRRRLNTGEYRARLTRTYQKVGNGDLQLDRIGVGLATVTAYLLDWSLTDDRDKPVVIEGLSIEDLTRVLDNLDVDTFGEILDAIEAHETTMDAAKKSQDGATPSPAISPSPSSAAGDTSGLPSSTLMSTTS